MKIVEMVGHVAAVCELLENIKPRIGAFDQAAILKSAAAIVENKAQAEIMAKSMRHALQQFLLPKER